MNRQFLKPHYVIKTMTKYIEIFEFANGKLTHFSPEEKYTLKKRESLQESKALELISDYLRSMDARIINITDFITRQWSLSLSYSGHQILF